jgi:glyoxylase-like metal-dependent hydrolase (beta-lactamase superfamily II)
MQVAPVDDRVFLVTGTNVNWAIVVDGTDVTLIDGGYPADAGDLVRSIREIGRRPEDVVTVLLTHAHLDHMGGLAALTKRYGTPVRTGAVEARHAGREFVEQISPMQMTAFLGNRSGRRWVMQTARAVGPHLRMSIDDVTAVEPGVPLDVPGRLVAVPTPGHTSGHTAYLLPSAGVLFSGDALITAHPVSRRGVIPQLIPSAFHADEARARISAESLRDVAADVIAPGHGPVWRGPLDQAVDVALAP